MTSTGGEDVVAALSALADEDVAALLEDVRRDGAQLARRRLTEAYADALVRAVATRGCRSAPSSPVALGCYVYAVVAGDGIGAGGGMTGIQPGGPVGAVTAGDISAVVSDVDVEAMRRGAASADVDEDGWLAAAARAHERVVLSAFHSAPTVPMRFGIVHPRREDVAELLAEHADSFRDELRRVQGSAEWSVKVHADATVVTARVGDDTDHTTGAAGEVGRGYLLRERSRRSLVERTRDFVASRVDEVAAELAAAAHDAVVTAMSHDPGDRPVLQAAYLLARSEEPEFASLVDAVAARVRPDGLAVELTGPWPPYHFTTLRLEASRA